MLLADVLGRERRWVGQEFWILRIQTCKKWFRDVPRTFLGLSRAQLQLPQFSMQSLCLHELRLEVQGKEHDRKLEVKSAASRELS